jgi:hypothetical protein
MADDVLAAPPTADAAPAPDYYDLRTEANKSKILALIRDKHTQWSKGGREAVIRNCWRNILFKRGHQWLIYDRSRGWWRPVSVTKYTGPRPVTNLFASHMNAFCAVLARIEPTLLFRPATDDAEDRASAEVADRIMEVCEDETDVRSVRQELAQWVGYTGGAWLESGVDPSPEHGMRLVQHEMCQNPDCGATSPPTTTGVCANCGSPTVPAVDDAGQPIGHEAPVGRMYTEVATVFEMYFDAGHTPWKTGVREYLRKKASDEPTLRRRWGADAVEGLSGDLGLTLGETYQEQLPTLAGYAPETGPGAGLFPRTGASSTRISEMYYWALPTDDYPQGVLAVVLGGQRVVSLGPLPYTRDDGQPFLPTVYFAIDPVPGSAYSKTPADDLALKQVQRNQHEAHMLMTLNRMAWPIWLLPEGTNIATFTGEPGQLLRYNAIGPTAAKPERVQGAGLPNGAITYLQQLDHEMEEITAAYAGTKGDRPSGVSAGIALQMIEDRKNQRFGPLYILWEHAWAEWARQQLAIFKQFATEPRLLKIQGRGSAWRVQQFLGSDLTGRVDVVAEAGSGAPMSTLVRRAENEQLVAMGALSMGDPEVVAKILADYGRSDWSPTMKADGETVAKQIELFEALAAQPPAVQLLEGLLAQAAQIQQASQQAFAAGQAPQPLPPVTYDQLLAGAAQQGLKLPRVRPQVDGHQVFARELGNWLKSDASQQLPEAIQAVVELKHAAHVQIMQMQAMQQMQMRAGTYPTSGFLSNPGGQQGPTGGGNAPGQPEPPSRMAGEQREQEQNAQ